MSDAMTLSGAQRDLRSTFLHGSAGQAVSGGVWLASAAAGTCHSPLAAIVVLVGGGTFIFPLTQLVLRLSGREASLPPGHPLDGLAKQTAFIVPALLPVVGGAALHEVTWFCPAMMIVVGAHWRGGAPAPV